MFDFLNDVGNYEDRVVGHYDGKNGLVVDTCRVSDGAKLYETAIEHPEYHDGKWVIVEAYDTPDEALFGHGKWMQIMTRKILPTELVDCANSTISQMLGAVDPSKMRFPRQRPKQLEAPD